MWVTTRCRSLSSWRMTHDFYVNQVRQHMWIQDNIYIHKLDLWCMLSLQTMSSDLLGSCQFIKQIKLMNKGWVKDGRMQLLWTMITKHLYTVVHGLQGTNFKVPSFIKKRILEHFHEIWKYDQRWLSYWCKWDDMILIWVNISEKYPSDNSEWSRVRD